MTAKIEHIKDLIPDAKNARKHNPRNIGMIEEALQEVGAARSIVIDENNNILAGNGTIEAAGNVGIEKLTVVEADGDTIVAVRRIGLTEEQKKRLALFDNRTAELADWEPSMLAELASEIKLDDLFSHEELDLILAGIETDEPQEVPKPQDPDADDFGETRAKRGDLFQCGNHRVMCGDCTNKEDVARLMDGAKADLIFADPPYGISIVAANGFVGGGEAYDIPFGGKKGNVGGGAAHMAKTGKPYIAEKPKGRGSAYASAPFGKKPLRGTNGSANMIAVGKYFPVIGDDSTVTAITAYDLLSELYPSAIQVWWGGNYYANHLPPSSCWLVWDKQNTGNFADVELAWTNQTTAARLFSHMWNGLMKESEKGVKRVHPTQKPIALAEWVLEKWPEIEVVFDPFLGSGISVMAGERLGKKVYGLELSEEYIEVILRRWETMTGEKAILCPQ